MWSEGVTGVKAGAAAVVLALALAGCDEGTGPDGGSEVAIAFSASGGAAASATAAARSLLPQDVALEGTNGTLVIEDLRIIVAEFELDRLNDDDCVDDDVSGVDDDSCEEFEAPPAFVDVPLDGGEVVAVTAAVEADTYDELEFEIEDLDDDEENPTKAQQIEELLADIRAEFPDWPRDASMLVTGTFTPTGGEPTPFRVYFEAEVEIEKELSPPVTISDDGDGGTFTVNLDPGAWFVRGDGTVLDLAALDFDATGDLVEFEFEMEDGIAEIEFEDD